MPVFPGCQASSLLVGLNPSYMVGARLFSQIHRLYRLPHGPDLHWHQIAIYSFNIFGSQSAGSGIFYILALPLSN